MGVGEKRLVEAKLHARGLSGAACRSWVEGVGEWTGRSWACRCMVAAMVSPQKGELQLLPRIGRVGKRPGAPLDRW